jgi:hypothetical protein
MQCPIWRTESSCADRRCAGAEKNSTFRGSFLDQDLSTFVETFESRDPVPFNIVIFDLHEIFISFKVVPLRFSSTTVGFTLTHGDVKIILIMAKNYMRWSFLEKRGEARVITACLLPSSCPRPQVKT